MRHQIKGSDSASTVTSLFCDAGDGKYMESWGSRSLRPKESSKISFHDKSYYSASKVLDKYIEEYDKQQTVELAKIIAGACTTPVKETHCITNPSTLEKEIRLAQKLLPTSYSESVKSSSLATDELLAMSSTAVQPQSNHLSSIKYAEELMKLKRTRHVGSPVLNLHKSRSHTFHYSPSTTSSSSLTSKSDSSISSYSRKKHSSRLRKALQFSADENSSEDEASSLPTSHHHKRRSSDDYEEIFPSSASLSTLRSNEIEDQMQDIDKTWRLVDDLKADLASTGTSTLQRHHPDRESLRDLIDRLTATARRKEDALRTTLDASLTKKHKRSARRKSVSESETDELVDLKSGHASSVSSTSDSTLERFSNDASNSWKTLEAKNFSNSISSLSHAEKHVCPSSVTNPDCDVTVRHSSPVQSPYNDSDKKSKGVLHQIDRIFPHKDDSDSTFLTHDNISEAMRLIDQRTDDRYDKKQIDRSDASLESTPIRTPDSVTLHAGRTPYNRRVDLSLAGGDMSAAIHGSPTETEKILEGDRTWEKIPPRKRSTFTDDDVTPASSTISLSFHMEGKPKAVKGFMEECLAAPNGDSASLSGGKQPGSVEALKNMIFSLQGLASSQRQGNDARNLVESFDGQDSLQRALHHLDNLKNITQK
uniref:Uncharacterized protein LOC100186732 n=1 Tax=Phallusia mammillata TaxID=59560 RepID=A0A6F9DHX6_9ASCI|nr:uncharacterized protein LOC100186732 [Phallusia mammillata]